MTASELERIVWDIICIIVLLIIPDILLEKTGLYRSIEKEAEKRLGELRGAR